MRAKGTVDNSSKLLVLAVVFIVFMETLFPRRKMQFFSREKIEDWIWLVLNRILFPFTVGSLIYVFSQNVTKLFNGRWGFDFANESLLFQFSIAVIVLDFVSYGVHRALHSIPWMWNFHKLHHSTKELNVFSSFRTSWADLIIIMASQVLTMAFFSFRLEVILWTNLVFSLICVAQHANIHLKVPRIVDWVFITHWNHYWHHSSESPFRYGHNFGLIFVWWDRLFRTYYAPEISTFSHTKSEVPLGLSDPQFPLSLWKRFFYPIDRTFLNFILKLIKSRGTNKT